MDASEHPGVNELAPTARRSVGAGVSVNAAQLRRNLQGWPARRWLTAAAVAVATFLVVGIPTDLIDTPLFFQKVRSSLETTALPT